MSLSFKDHNENLKPYIKLEIHESIIYPKINVPLPYGINISLGNFPEKNIEQINNKKEVFQFPKNQFFYYFDKNTFNCTDMEFILNTYTTSIFIIKKNFASVKIPISLNKDENNKRQWYYLKDISNNTCVKILLSIDININNYQQKVLNNNKLDDIISKNNKASLEYKKINISRTNTNYIFNNHNTHLISTNYNSSRGNSLLNLTNNINNLNITLPINLSPITLIEKSNSFFMDSKNKQMENNMKIINNNLSYKNKIKSKNKKYLTNLDEDSIIINDNDIEEIEENNDDKEKNNIEKIENKINKLINQKNNELDNKIFFNNFNEDNKVKVKYKKEIKNLEKSNDLKTLNITENLKILEKEKYRQYIKKEINDYENSFFKNLNFIANINNNLEQLLLINDKNQTKKRKKLNNITPRKAESFNAFNIFSQEKNKTKKSILPLNQKIPHNPLHIKKLNFKDKTKRKLTNYINSGRKLNNKNNTPVNDKSKNLKRKVSSSTLNISNSENINNENKDKIIKTEGKNKIKNFNNNTISALKFKKIYKINFQRKSLKTQGNLKNSFNEALNNKHYENSYNNQNKYSFVKINLNKEKINSKKTFTNTNNKKYFDKGMNKNYILKTRTIENDIIKKNNKSNCFRENNNITSDKDKFSLKSISPKTVLNKFNNLGKKKLKLKNKAKFNNNNKKILNLSNSKAFNIFEGNSLFIKRNNNIKNNYIRLNTNPNEDNKKKNIKFRNYLNLTGNILLLNVQKSNESILENKRKISNQKILQTEFIN